MTQTVIRRSILLSRSIGVSTFPTKCRCKNVFCDVFHIPVIWHREALRSLKIDNAGGKSEVSEACSIHHLATLFESKTCILEKEVKYWIDYKMVDYILPTGKTGARVGVSVTRAMQHRGKFTGKDAIYLLNKKINGLIVARRTICRDHSFMQSILHVFAQTKRIAKTLRNVIESGEVDLKKLGVEGSLDIWITVTGHEGIFTNNWKDK